MPPEAMEDEEALQARAGICLGEGDTDKALRTPLRGHRGRRPWLSASSIPQQFQVGEIKPS